MNKKTALLVGATGLVGNELLQILVDCLLPLSMAVVFIVLGKFCGGTFSGIYATM